MTDTQSSCASTAVELTIVTPEGVLFRLPLAGPAPRLYAMLLDVAIVLGTVNGIGLLVYWIFAKAPGFGVMVITLAEFASLWRIAGRFLERADDWKTAIPFARD